MDDLAAALAGREGEAELGLEAGAGHFATGGQSNPDGKCAPDESATMLAPSIIVPTVMDYLPKRAAQPGSPAGAPAGKMGREDWI
jgi:hypothetical protein